MTPFSLLGLEPLIIDRLRTEVPDIDIASVASIAGAMNLTKHMPFVVVTPAESDVVDSKSGRAGVESQLWLVTLFHETMPDKRLKDAVFQDAGEALTRVFYALQGWVPAAGCKPLEYAGRPEAHHAGGWSAFALAFRCEVILRTSRSI